MLMFDYHCLMYHNVIFENPCPLLSNENMLQHKYLHLPFVRDESTTLYISQCFGCHLQKSRKYRKTDSKSNGIN